MEERNEVTNQNEGSTTSSIVDTGEYFELFVHDQEGSTGPRNSPPLPPRKSPRNFHSLGKPRALPPPASCAIDDDSIARNCDHFNQTVIPPPLPAKTYDRRTTHRSCPLVDKAIQCSLREEVSRDSDLNTLPFVTGERRAERPLISVDFLPSTREDSIRTPVSPPRTNDTLPPLFVPQNKATPNAELESAGERTANRRDGDASGTRSGSVLESLAPSLARSQSRGCANEYVGDPVSRKKSSFETRGKKIRRLDQSRERTRKTQGLVCKKCLKCKCNQCRIEGSRKKDPPRKTNAEENCRKESSSRPEDIEQKTAATTTTTRGPSEETSIEIQTDGRPSCRVSALLLCCFSAACCSSWGARGDRRTRSSDGCRCREDDEVEDDVFLSSNS